MRRLLAVALGVVAAGLAGCALFVTVPELSQGPPDAPADPLTTAADAGDTADAAVASLLPGDASAWAITFDDEFDGPGLDVSRWSTSISLYGDLSEPGNDDLECYTEGNFLFDRGLVDLIAKSQTFDCPKPLFQASYTSGALASYGKFSQAYGYFEIRARMAPGAGLYSVFWMLPADGSYPPAFTVAGLAGSAPTMLNVSQQYAASDATTQAQSTIATTGDATADLHIYGVHWTSSFVAWFVDGREVFRSTVGVPGGARYLLVNLVVGGVQGGSVGADTVFPSTMAVDFVRAYRCLDETACGG